MAQAAAQLQGLMNAVSAGALQGAGAGNGGGALGMEEMGILGWSQMAVEFKVIDILCVYMINYTYR